ncbi:MAG: ABC transporter substrate-binding protein, partial [Poseidonia sp.]
MRIVSLVPSLTLTLFDFGLDATSIVGRTPWCIHPADEVSNVPVVGGTKTPNLGKIKAAKPDVVVMDRDENPKAVYEWCLEQGYETFVCHVQHPRDVPDMLRELGKVVKRSEEAET